MGSKNSRGGRNTSKGSKSSSGGRSGRVAANESASRLACPNEGCDRTYANETTLARHVAAAHPLTTPPIETADEAVERTLRSIDLTDRHAVTVAAVRRLAKALEECEPTDTAKISKELAAQMASLLDMQPPDAGDWTDGEDEE